MTSSSTRVDKIFIETEGGCIYTLTNVLLSEKVINLKRFVKVLLGIPIASQEIMIVGGDFRTLKNTSRLEAYPISNETILKVYQVC